jgi:hypothetical protein
MLAPYTRPGANPFLVDIAADLGRPISLRLSDKSCVELPLSLDLDQAQARLQQLGNSRKVCVCVCVGGGYGETEGGINKTSGWEALGPSSYLLGIWLFMLPEHTHGVRLAFPLPRP